MPSTRARAWARHTRLAAVLVLLPVVVARAGAQQTDTAPPNERPIDLGRAGSPMPDLARFLTVRSADYPSLSRDGEQLSFITSTTGHPQLWAVSIASGYPGAPAPRQLTFGSPVVTADAWSPAGGWIFYAATDPATGNRVDRLIAPDGMDERQLLAPGDTTRRFGAWSPDGSRIAITAHPPNGTGFTIDILSVAADGTVGAPRRVFKDADALSIAAWRPDGGALVLSRARGSTANDLLQLDLATGRVDTLFAPDSAASFRDVVWTPDGRGFYLATDDGRDVTGLTYYDTTARALTWISVSRYEVRNIALSPTGRWLAWTENVDGYAALHVLDLLGTGAEEHPDVPAGVYRIAWAPHAPVLSIHIAGPRTPGDIFVYNAPTHRLTRATQSATAGLDPDQFVAPRPVSFPSWDKETIHALLYLPPSGGPRRPPVLLALHEDPAGQALPTYRPLFQYLLTRGIAVLDVDYRGSGGYGRRFEQSDDDSIHTGAVRDVAGALDWLAHARIADTARAAVFGAAYGGYLACRAASALAGRIKAAVAMDVTPIPNVDRIDVPLMVTYGIDGERGSLTRSDSLVDAIRAHGDSVAYVRVSDPDLDVPVLTRRIRAYRRIAAFLEHALTSGPARAAP